MRFRAHWLLGLCGLALAVPAAAMAAPLGDDEPGYAVVGGQPQQAPQHHKGLFHRRHCVECQRAYAKAHDGVDIPAPPPIVQGPVTQGQVVGTPAGVCDVCQGGTIVSGPIMASNATAAPGYAVVGEGGQGMDPAPIGVFRAGHAQPGDPRMAAMGQRGGAPGYDDSVVPTSLPPAQVALAGPGANRPHIISHLFGIPKFGQIHRERADRERQKHAAIAYDHQNQPVTELPASVVYGKK
jgi:hypothetical protein